MGDDQLKKDMALYGQGPLPSFEEYKARRMAEMAKQPVPIPSAQPSVWQKLWHQTPSDVPALPAELSAKPMPRQPLNQEVTDFLLKFKK